MSQREQTARLAFLQDAAHLLAASAPETSSHLMSTHLGLVAAQDMPLTDSRRQQTCTCCGGVLLPGVDGTTMSIMGASQVRKHTRRKVKKPRADEAFSKIITCGHCDRYTKIKLPSAEPIKRRKLTATAAPANASTAPEEPSGVPEAKKTVNASSKRRAKSRKAGLQALLDQGRATTPSSSSLSLSTFLKP